MEEKLNPIRIFNKPFREIDQQVSGSNTLNGNSNTYELMHSDTQELRLFFNDF